MTSGRFFITFYHFVIKSSASCFIFMMWFAYNCSDRELSICFFCFFLCFTHLLSSSNVCPLLLISCRIRTTKSLQNHGGDLAGRGEVVGVVGGILPLVTRHMVKTYLRLKFA